MFLPSEAYVVYGFLIGVKLQPLLSQMKFRCKYQIWCIVNSLAILAERGIKKESDSLPDGISHHTAQLLGIMAVAILHDGEARAEILMLAQSQQEVNDKVPLTVNWEFIAERHGEIFSSRAASFVSALCRYGDHDEAVFEETVRLLRDELGGCIDWGDEDTENGPDIILKAKLHKLRDRYLRILDRFIRQMEEYAATLGARDVLYEWQIAGQGLRQLRSMPVIMRFDWAILNQAHRVCSLINLAMTDTMSWRMMAEKQAVLLPAPPRSLALPAPVEEGPDERPTRKYHHSKTEEWSKKDAAKMAGVGVRQLSNWEKKPPDSDYPGWEDPVPFTKWINNRKDKALMAIALKNSVSYKETATEKSMKKR